MTDTTRIYNRKKIRKCQRPKFVVHDYDQDGFGVVDQSRSTYAGLPFQEHGQICMGRCKSCRDPHKNQIIQRKRRFQEFRKILKEEEL